MTSYKKVNDTVELSTSIANLDKCRAIAGGKWDKKISKWVYPVESILHIASTFPDANVDITTKSFIKLYKSMKEHTWKLLKGEIEPQPHQFLMRHQRVALDIAKINKKWGFFMDTGTGKTLTALAIIADDLKKELTTWLVICPKSIINTAWVADAAEWYPDIRVLSLSKNMKREDYQEVAKKWGYNYKITSAALGMKLLIPHATVLVVNPEAFKTMDFSGTGVTRLVVDESSMLKDNSSGITKDVTSFAKNMERVYLLSGKPAPNSELEYFSQIRIIDPSVFGTSFHAFKDRYFNSVGYLGFKLEPKYGAIEEIGQKLATCSYTVSKDDCLDLPDKTYITREFELDANTMKIYKDMARTQVALLKDTTLAVDTKLTALMKLRQITSGFIIDTEQNTTTKLYKGRLNELKEIITELGDNKAIIWINFKQEVNDIMDLLAGMGKSFATAYSQTTDVDKSIIAFKENRVQFMIAHPKTLKYGVTFTGPSMSKNCTYSIYYSLSHSYEDYYQSHDRIYRKGQTEKTTFIFIECKGTIDKEIKKCVTEKGSKTDLIENIIKSEFKD